MKIFENGIRKNKGFQYGTNNFYLIILAGKNGGNICNKTGFYREKRREWIVRIRDFPGIQEF